MKAQVQFDKDVKFYKPPSAMTWMPPRIPKPRTKAEKMAIQIMQESSSDPQRLYMVHIYRVLELIETAYKRGLEDGKK